MSKYFIETSFASLTRNNLQRFSNELLTNIAQLVNAMHLLACNDGFKRSHVAVISKLQCYSV